MKIDYTNVVNNDDVAPYRFLEPLNGWYVTVTTVGGNEVSGYVAQPVEEGKPIQLLSEYQDGKVVLSVMPDRIVEVVIA